MLLLVTARGGHLGSPICIYMKWFHSGAIVIESDQHSFFLIYWHLGKKANVSDTEASFFLSISDGFVKTKIYDK